MAENSKSCSGFIAQKVMLFILEFGLGSVTPVKTATVETTVCGKWKHDL
jgi:hypothetical protein